MTDPKETAALVAMYQAVTTLLDRLQTLIVATAKLRARIVRSLLAGRTTREVGAMLGVSGGRISQIANSHPDASGEDDDAG